MQNSLMKFDPATGEEKPYPSNAEQYRVYHGQVAWLFNPWSGDTRSAHDVGSDVFGLLIDAGEPLIDARSYVMDDKAVIAYLKEKTGWSDDWIKSGFNGCFDTATNALKYISRRGRPSGGEDKYNSIHLDQIAQEIEMTRKKFFGDKK